MKNMHIALSPKFTKICLYDFFVLVILLAMISFINDPTIVVFLSYLFGFLLFTTFVIVIIYIYKSIYAFSEREHLPQLSVGQLRSKLFMYCLISLITSLFIYIFLLTFTMACNTSFLDDYYSAIVQLIQAMRNNVLYGVLYAVNTVTQTACVTFIAILSCVLSSILLFERYRILAAIFFTILCFVIEMFLIGVISNQIIKILGGIVAIFQNLPNMAVPVILGIESISSLLMCGSNYYIVIMYHKHICKAMSNT